MTLYWDREEGKLAELINDVDDKPQEEIEELGIRAKKNVYKMLIHGKNMWAI